MKNKIVLFDLGGSSIKYSIDNLNTFLVFEVEKISKEKVLSFIADISNKNKANIICISAPGIIDIKTGKISGLSAINDWFSDNIYKEIFTFLNNKKTRIFIDNDGNCALIGNISKYEKKVESAVSVVIGTGIGGAYYNGKIQRGFSNAICEFGMMKIGIEGNKTISSELSINALCNRVNIKLHTNYSGYQIFELYRNNVDEIKKIVNVWFEELSIFIYNIIWLFDPEVIFIGGAISQNDIFKTKLLEKIAIWYDGINIFRLSKIKFSDEGNKINLLGAKLLLHEHQILGKENYENKI